MKVADIGLKKVYTVEPTESLVAVARLMSEHAMSTVPVCEDGKLVGIITQRDITVGCVSTALNAWTCQVSDFMTVPPVTVSPEQDVEDAIRIMKRTKLRKLPVIDDHKQLVGMLTLNDIAMTYVEQSELIAETMRNTTTQNSNIAA